MENENKAEIASHGKKLFEGVVIPAEWDEIGNNTAVALAADDEKEYRINENNAAGKHLRNVLYQRVRLQGFIDTGAAENQNKVITVESYQVLKNNIEL
jgi:hypothetical protein